MFQSITWSSYWTFMIEVFSAYYIAVYLVCYRLPKIFAQQSADSKKFMGSNYPPEYPPEDTGIPTNIPPPASDDPQAFDVPPEDSAENAVYSLMDELTAFFSEAKKSRWERGPLTHSLSRIVKKYASINASPYKDSVSKVIAREAAHHCSVQLDPNDMALVWQETTA